MKKKDRLQELMEEYGEICKKAIPVLFKSWFEMEEKDKQNEKNTNKKV
jgi:hypothetical protein